MPFPEKVFTYAEALGKLPGRTRHILLGNGFSIACDGIFSYPSLYDAAIRAGLSKRAQEVFEHLGTNNFEGVMRLLDDAHWVALIYGIEKAAVAEMPADVEKIKIALVEAIASSHLEHTGKIPDHKKDAALTFLSPYKNIFTTNYDLIAYWIDMHANDRPWGDGFRSDQDDAEAEYVVFSERLGNQRGLFYIHGALHLYLAGGELQKHTWVRSGKPLTQLIREGLEHKEYPLFVAEGTPQGKLDQIQRHGYLWYCLDKLARIESPLVVYGHALGDSDRHITSAIAQNGKLETIAVGLHGDPGSPSNQAIYQSTIRMRAMRNSVRRGKQLEVVFYQSETANAWG